MFESLSDKLKRTLKNLRGEGVLTKEHVDAALREIRLALLEADVNYKVAKDFIASVKEKAEGQQVWLELKPSEQVVKIVFDELVDLLGGHRAGSSGYQDRPVGRERRVVMTPRVGHGVGVPPRWSSVVEIDQLGGIGGCPCRGPIAATNDHDFAGAVHHGGAVVAPAVVAGSHRDPVSRAGRVEIRGLLQLAGEKTSPFGATNVRG